MDSVLPLVKLIVTTLAQIVRKVLPFVIQGIGYAIVILAATIVTIAKSINDSSKAIAEEWRRKAGQENMDSRIADRLYWPMRIAALLLIFFGWIMLAYLTTWFINWLIRREC